MPLLKRIYKTVFPSKIRLFLHNHLLFFTDKKQYEKNRKNRKRTVSFGPNNKDKHFFVCRRDSEATGLLACYVNVLGQLIEIDKDIQSGKLIPVMDMYTQYFAAAHRKGDGVQKINAWEYYFAPFSEYTMEEVLKSKHVTLGYGFLVDAAKPFVQDNEYNRSILRDILPIHNRYFHLRSDLEKQFSEKTLALFGDKRVLGTNIREGYIVLANGKKNKEASYTGQIIDGHPVQPDIDTFCDELKEKMIEWNCEYIFAEFQTTYIEKKFKEYFGDKFICTNRKRVETDNLSLNSYMEGIKKRPSNYDVVENNIAYLESIYLLSKCTSLYTAKCSGTVVATLWNNDKYENMEIINRGKY